MPAEDETPSILQSSVNIFLCLKSGTCPCLALGRCMAFSPVFCLAAQYCQVQRFCLFCSSFGLLLFPWPIRTAEEIELSLWVFTVSIVRSKRLFLLVLSHRKGLVAKWHFGVTQYVYPYGSLYLSVRHPIFYRHEGPESQRSRFLLWCLNMDVGKKMTMSFCCSS